MRSVNPSSACCGNLLPIHMGDDRFQRKEDHSPNHSAPSSHGYSTWIFPWRTSIMASFGSDCLNCFFAPPPAAGHTLCRKPLRISRGRNQTELYSFEKSFSVSEAVSKSLQCSSPLACGSVFESDLPDNLDSSTNCLAKPGLLAGGLLLWQFPY